MLQAVLKQMTTNPAGRTLYGDRDPASQPYLSQSNAIGFDDVGLDLLCGHARAIGSLREVKRAVGARRLDVETSGRHTAVI
jgi:hypothetical protein